MQVVWLAERLEACNLFNEAQWFISTTITFTAACLVLFVISNDQDPTLHEIEDAVCRLKGLCLRHAEQNSLLQGCVKFLDLSTNQQLFLQSS